VLIHSLGTISIFRLVGFRRYQLRPSRFRRLAVYRHFLLLPPYYLVGLFVRVLWISHTCNKRFPTAKHEACFNFIYGKIRVFAPWLGATFSMIKLWWATREPLAQPILDLAAPPNNNH
jgi:hypothetical protein